MYSLFQRYQQKQQINNPSNYIIYFAYIFLTLFAIFSYTKKSGFNREEKTDYEYDGIIPSKYRKIVVYSCLIGNYDKVSTFNKFFLSNFCLIASSMAFCGVLPN